MMTRTTRNPTAANFRPALVRWILALLAVIPPAQAQLARAQLVSTPSNTATPEGQKPISASQIVEKLSPPLPPIPAFVGDPACLPSKAPSATLLVPYFEVDLDEQDGITTLFSVANADPEPVLVRAVVWTDCSMPVLTFDLHLGPNQVVPVNLRDVIANGVVPDPGLVCSEGEAVATAGLGPQQLDDQVLATLQARLTGQPDPDDGLCYGQPYEGPRLARGAITLDAMRNVCDPAIRYPFDPGYFNRPEGLPAEDRAASSRNVLWGDVFLIDPGQSSAQGFRAVGLRADSERVEDLQSGNLPFYAFGDRLPLPSRFRTRYLSGGGFDGGTRLLLTHHVTFGAGRPVVCEEGCSQGVSSLVRFRFHDESGQLVGASELDGGAHTLSLQVGGEILPIHDAAGWIDIQTFERTTISPPELPKLWVQPVYTARDRFSVSLEATAVETACRESSFAF